MVKATSSRESGCQVEGSGSLAEQLNDVLNIIGSLHASMKRFGGIYASAFQKLLILSLLDLDGAVWHQEPGAGFSCVMPKKKDGDGA